MKFSPKKVETRQMLQERSGDPCSWMWRFEDSKIDILRVFGIARGELVFFGVSREPPKKFTYRIIACVLCVGPGPTGPTTHWDAGHPSLEAQCLCESIHGSHLDTRPGVGRGDTW